MRDCSENIYFPLKVFYLIDVRTFPLRTFFLLGFVSVNVAFQYVSGTNYRKSIKSHNLPSEPAPITFGVRF